MRKIITVLAAMCFLQSAMAITIDQQHEVLKQLEVARAEINAVKSLIPGFLRSSIGRNLNNADERIAYAQQILDNPASVSSKYYCTVESAFDGQFAGTGNTELEAFNNALQSCKIGSRANGFHCKKNSRVCEREQ
ncbi:MAG: hypothetical protein ACOYOK_13440 [Pseudobdellovibrionaceae bacterium]|jgi:hypothetical protein